MVTTSSPAVLRRLHPFVLGIAFLSTYYVALLGPILPAIAGPLGGDALAIGLLFSTYSLAQFLTAPVLGALGDRYGRRIVLLFSVVGALVGFSIFTVGAATGAGLWVLFTGWIIVGACDCWIATAFSYVADTTRPGTRARFFAFLTAAIGSAFVVGPATSGFFSTLSPVMPLLVLLALLCAALIWGYFSMPESLPPAQRATSLHAAQMNPLSALRDVLRFPQLRLLLLSYLMFWPSVIALSANLPTLMAERAAWDTGRIASLLVLYGALVVVVQLGVIPILAQHFRAIHLAIAGAVLSVAAFAMLAAFTVSASIPLVYLGVTLFGLGQPLVQTGITAATSESVDARTQGRAQGAVAATMALAQVVGPLVIGWLYQAAGPQVAYTVIVAQIVVAIALMLAAIPRLARAMDAQRAMAAPHTA
ncbi:MFS transporter [Mycolicibacterium sp. BiH015]|uniref:MFS transporter n=1 Tax=Mycolicibacterium sp. BiH015 TaxID=3018808 RepID=UPI0022E4AEB8|nr:MFS transporter [Mycolicibacterium sp. BiH015]MDA2892613.1 MFS transporter [Mycolicibacterium sp. BiH015]